MKNAILAGDAPVSGNEFNLIKTKEEYFKYLDNIKNLKPMTNQEKSFSKENFLFLRVQILESDITSNDPQLGF